MKPTTLIFACLMLLALTACNNSAKPTAAESVSTEDSSAFDLKASSENLEQQAKDLDQEVDSLVNSLK